MRIRPNRYSSVLRATLPFGVLGAAGLLTFMLVASILTFSEKVTSYYTPSILAFDNFLEGSEHLKKSISEHTQVGPNDVAYGHFAMALKQVRALAEVDPDASHELLHDQVFETAQKVIEQANSSKGLRDTSIMDPILEGASRLADDHRHDLAVAKQRIRQFVIITAALCFIILCVGTFYSVREYRLVETKKREAATRSALVALVRALDARDPYTKGHSERVAMLASRLGKKMGLSSKELQELTFAALLHDIGKIGIPDNILKKEGRLSEEEYAEMKHHPAIGATVLETSITSEVVLGAIKHHHERWDGNGYPLGLEGNEIPKLAQIIAMADAYDAMTSSRPYRQGMSQEVVVNEIQRCSGKQWSDELVWAFIKTLK
ncbi:MAG: hypothetical protein CL942_00035 [Desulfovibrio sp.]|nr:hypothetical protein [Desulfovibrio sp.]|tara:strand:+ start:22645 stop:23772 length:1128 start_codon:yes stop_codon:yes gene_type:complete